MADMRVIYASGFVLLALAALVLVLVGPGNTNVSQQTTTTIQPTTTIPPVTTSSTESTSTTSTTSTTQSTTTTTIAQYLRMPWWDMSKCRESQIGKMNIFFANITDDVQGRWNMTPADAILYSCDDSPLAPVDKAFYKGIGTIGIGDPIPGEYRLQIRCGHNAHIVDLNDCKELKVYLDRLALDGGNKTSE